ncbi:hypothetical protein KGF56_004566 [Candida oxycetoniae]|uniref:Chromatin target of PRMT1 protein C-terminal domain-containing protein n=1 Tax=Candida oxycetoniae TaxID=497107 RepID=A0AAI9STM1_9ASCO|nr:uncharacterized protein KGF56_004566 [Candida oxycetoniae]KAI3402685.2 hypothetical protein KGF56_004566 [Candida oxycetoniae]
MSNILEKSLDDIIGEKGSQRKFIPTRRRGLSSSRRSNNNGHPYRRHPPLPHRGVADVYIPRATSSSSSSSSVPRDVLQMADGRPTLRLKNIHPELNGEDLNKLFSSINDVDFIKFDEENDTVAYICFQNDCERSNRAAIEKYDGKKAMGKILIVENAVNMSLAERITVAPSRNTDIFTRDIGDRGSGTSGRSRRGRGRGGLHGRGRGRGSHRFGPKKSAEDLDKELNEYMGQNGDEQESMAAIEQAQEEMNID